MATVSVIIPLYNKEQMIGRAIRSVLNQTMPDFEIVVVDDGSTDGSRQVVETMGDKRIRLIRQENAGVSAARNRGIREARCDLIAFLDADDVWQAEFLATVHTLFERYTDCAVLATCYCLQYGDGGTPRPARIQGLSGDFQGVLDDYFAIAARSEPPMNSSTVCIRKHALLDVHGFPVGVTSGEDLLTWARLAARYRIAYSMKPMAVISKRSGRVNELMPRLPAHDDQVGRELAKLSSLPNVCMESLSKYRSRWHKMRFACWLRHARRWQALLDLLQAISLHPLNARLYLHAPLLLLPRRLWGALLRR